MSKFKVCQKTMRMKIVEEIFVTSLEKDGKCMREYEESESDEDNEESK